MLVARSMRGAREENRAIAMHREAGHLLTCRTTRVVTTCDLLTGSPPLTPPLPGASNRYF
jgi:hypothetical protein